MTFRLPLCGILALAAFAYVGAAGARDGSPPPAEVAATLGDMIAHPDVIASFRARVWVPPDEYERRFAPQSGWGRERVEEYRQRWNEAVDAFAATLRLRNELDLAFSEAGVRIPVSRKVLAEVPGYGEIDRLLHNVRLDPCDQEAKVPDCYVIVRLGGEGAARPTVRSIVFVDPAGAPIRLPGKAQ